MMVSLVLDLILLAKQVDQAVNQAKSFKLNCRKIGKQVYQLSQMLNTLFCFTTLNPSLFTYFNPSHLVIDQVSNTLHQALTMACTCKRRTMFCRLFTPRFHDLYHLLDNCIAIMNWLLILYNPDFGTAFDEIFLSFPEIVGHESSMVSAWSFMVTECMVWKLVTLLSRETSSLELRLGCMEALSMLDVGSVLINSRMMEKTELREELMICLAKLVEEEHGDRELRYNCLMIIVEITAAAESDLLFRLKAFKTNSPGTKAIIEQLLRVIEKSDDSSLQVLAIKSIGSLARIFIARENHRVIGVLVPLIGNERQKLGSEALLALQKFVSPANFLRKEHSKRMIELDVVQPLLKLMSDGERATEQLQGLVLMCYLAVNAEYCKAMEEAMVRTAIQQLTTKRRGRTIVSQHPELKQLAVKALNSLALHYPY